MALGNRIEDGAYVEEMSSAVQSRLSHFVLKMDHEDWLKWASKNDIDYTITAFIEQQPRMLNTFDMQGDDFTFASPRTYQFLSNYIKAARKSSSSFEVDISKQREVVAHIGSFAGVAYTNFASLGLNLPKVSEVISNPLNCALPEKLQESYLMSALLSAHLSDSNSREVIVYLDRMNIPELTISCLRNAVTRNSTLATNKHISSWLVEHGLKFLKD